MIALGSLKSLNSSGGMITTAPKDITSFGVFMMVMESTGRHIAPKSPIGVHLGGYLLNMKAVACDSNEFLLIKPFSEAHMKVTALFLHSLLFSHIKRMLCHYGLCFFFAPWKSLQ